MTLRACVPIDPVEPNIAMRFKSECYIFFRIDWRAIDPHLQMQVRAYLALVAGTDVGYRLAGTHRITLMLKQ